MFAFVSKKTRQQFFKVVVVSLGSLFLLLLLQSCSYIFSSVRKDNAQEVAVTANGSLQNPAWSPDGKNLLFTSFKIGYGKGRAELRVLNLETRLEKKLLSNKFSNVNLPGSSWNARTRRIVFASALEPHDEIFSISETGDIRTLRQITRRQNLSAYEPSYSPDGRQIVFESHPSGEADNGIIILSTGKKTKPYITISDPEEDSRQPNWSPTGKHIVYQMKSNNQWDLWVYELKFDKHYKLTNWRGDKTDASFSPDGKWVVFSGYVTSLKNPNLFIIPTQGGDHVRLTYNDGYDGAPSWSPDGKHIAFESTPYAPERSSGASIMKIEVPQNLLMIIN
jgi:TolB protein